eukprot:Protomagalhaensia_sp_Gyna_25__573@NODE_126_length_5040_cov_41_993801_g99_i0_p2_GENE_NODE_126_length_5040_cov_41_993801_g99_i0NODE_126_length_5040_cov_41_993801_g99_i0_p2_ORF_typecomplete_len476_score78_73PP2C/PF00481_21/4_5e49PP2C_2/PF13672_6/2_7e16SpoIIE/PF07228_12/0_0053SpoIIE/PF07228_12/0_0048_NODE_126_length_5040_cov_41_993801_g99_i024413868
MNSRIAWEGVALRVWPSLWQSKTPLVVFCDEPLVVKPAIPSPPAKTEKLPQAALTPRRLQVELGPKSKEAKPSEEFSLASPAPSAWPQPWALFQVNSNSPVEDRAFVSLHNIKKTFLDEALSTSGWLAAAIIDGHSGWQTAEFVQKHLGPKIEKYINALKDQYLTAESVGKALTACFEQLDNDIKTRIDPAFNLGYCNVAKPGATTCCCLLSPTKIICANVGDSVAVLCRNGRTIRLSQEHNCGVPEEGEKLRRLHPNEADIVYNKTAAEKKKKELAGQARPELQLQGGWMPQLASLSSWVRVAMEPFLPSPQTSSVGNNRPACYVKGRLQLTRAFGDFYLKESRYARDVQNAKLLVDPPHSFPYVIASPDVSILDRDKANDEFLLIATDGLWDWISPDDACQFLRPLLRKRLRVPDCLAKLKEHVYEKWVEAAATSTDLAPLVPATIEKLKALSPGERRKRFDDMTIVLVKLSS